jgi:hypothetical protein
LALARKPASSASGAIKDSTAEGQFSAEEKKANRHRLVSANVPAIVYEKGISTYAPAADRVRQYLQSGAFKEDLKERRGVYLYGIHAKRSDIFAIVAKILVLNSMQVYYASLHTLVGMLENDAERKNFLGRVDHLFIDNVQRRYVHEPDHCPYPRSIIAEVEELIEYRRTHGHITHMSSALDLDKLTWINRDTVEAIKDCLTPIALG